MNETFLVQNLHSIPWYTVQGFTVTLDFFRALIFKDSFLKCIFVKNINLPLAVGNSTAVWDGLGV
jgi:hypothetical protein